MSYYLTAQVRLRPNSHQRRLIAVALRRWHNAVFIAAERARNEQRALLRCIERGQNDSMRINGKALHTLAVQYCRRIDHHLHSSASASLVVEVEAMLGSWLALRAEWMKGGRKTPEPSFPRVCPLDRRRSKERWNAVLDRALTVQGRRNRERWQADLTREARDRGLPMAFGATTSGGPNGMAHCGILRRRDRRLFALLTLWPVGDALGAPVERAPNRVDSGDIANVRSEDLPFDPKRARSSILVPIQCGRGHRRLFLGRAIPKSAKLCRREEGGCFLNIAFEFKDADPKPMSGAVLALQRGIRHLIDWIAVDTEGRVLESGSIDGRDLYRVTGRILMNRAVRQQKGRITRGDRRAAAVAEHHLYSAGHQIIDIACRLGAEIVTLEDPYRRRPTPILGWKHFHRLSEILGQLTMEAGLPPARERAIFGSWKVCPFCGYVPEKNGDDDDQRRRRWSRKRRVKAPHASPNGTKGTSPDDVPEPQSGCPNCGREDPDLHRSRLLAWDTLRCREIYRAKKEKALDFPKLSLSDYIRSRV